MSNKIKNSTILVMSFLGLLYSCARQDVAPGRYEIMGYRITRQALQDSIEISHGPKFEFHSDRKRVTVSSDFDFGCFTDSVYFYKYRDGILHLDGPNDRKIIFCEPFPDGNGYTLFLDEKYIEQISICKEN